MELDKIAPALLQAQKAIKGAKKDAQNPHLKNRYADLASVFEACKGPLNEAGIVITQVMRISDGRNAMQTLLIHESGQSITAEALLPDIDQKGINAAQAMGSAISYMRRYQLSAMAGVLQEDDDGNAVSQPDKPAEPALEPLTYDQLLGKLESADNVHHMGKRWLKPEFQAGLKLLSKEQRAEVDQKKADMKTHFELEGK